jgi:hypothetical protein
VLAKYKEHELSGVRRKLELLGGELMQHLDAQTDASKIASEFNALTAYESRLQDTRTWPYNTNILRTLFFAFLVPLGSFLVKTLIDLVMP